VLEALAAGQRVERVILAEGVRSTGPIAEIRKRATELSIPVKTMPRKELERLAPDLNHQGVVAEAGRFRYASFESLFQAGERLLLFLDGVTDPHNLGALLRSADGAGFSGVVIPTRRSAAVTPTVRKVAAGAAEVVPVARVASLGTALEQAKRNGFWVVGLDGKATEDLWSSDLLEAPLALVLGAEGRGISQGIRGRCDGFVRIPSVGALASLNVSVAGALAMFELARRRSASDTL